MKRKVLSFVLVCALTLSCFAAVSATADTNVSNEKTVGGKLVAKSSPVLTSWNGNDGDSADTNREVNTSFKGIEFPDEDGVRTFKFAAYNASGANVTIALSCSYGTVPSIKNDSIVAPKGFDATARTVETGKSAVFSLSVPNKAYWFHNNVNGAGNGSQGKLVDGSGVGLRIIGLQNYGSLYIACIDGDSSVTGDEIAQVNKNLAELTFNTYNNTVSQINSWNDSEETRLLFNAVSKVSCRLFEAVRYTGTTNAGSYYKLFTPDLSDVKLDGDDTVTAKLAIYNNSDTATFVRVYPQASYKDIKGTERQTAFIGAKEWHEYTVTFATSNGKVMRVDDLEFEVSKVFYRMDVLESQTAPGTCAYDLTAVNTSNSKYTKYDKGNADLIDISSYNPIFNIEASITLNDSIAWNLYGEGIDKVDVTFNGNTTTVKFENGKAVFDDIAAKMMADKITFKFYQTIGGKEFTKEITTSVKEYMEEIIGGSYGETAKTLAIDTLNYGTATQVYDNYDVENLANAGLTDEQKVAYLSITKPVRDYGQTGEGFKFKAASLYLKDKVYIKMYIAKSDYKEGMTVRVNGTAELTEWKASGNYMYVMTDGISANELSNTVTAAVYENNTQVSTTLTYSAGTYAANKWDSNSAELASLVKALVKYGNSAAAYTE